MDSWRLEFDGQTSILEKETGSSKKNDSGSESDEAEELNDDDADEEFAKALGLTDNQADLLAQREIMREVQGTANPLPGFEHDKATLDIPRDQQYDLMAKLRKGRAYDPEAVMSTAQLRLYASEEVVEDRDIEKIKAFEDIKSMMGDTDSDESD